MDLEKEYIKRFRRSLSVPSRRKKEILRDVTELFHTAREHGEEAHDVISRLGTPETFAKSLSEPFQKSRKRSKHPVRTVLLLLVGIICICAYSFSLIPFYPSNAIGHADSETAVTIVSDFDPLLLLLLCGSICLIAGIISAIQLLNSQKQ